jgi:hypothetical protein
MCGIQLDSFGFESIYRNRATTGLLENEPLECRVPNLYIKPIMYCDYWVKKL